MKRRIIFVALLALFVPSVIYFTDTDNILGKKINETSVSPTRQETQIDSKFHGLPLATKEEVDLKLSNDINLMKQEITTLKSEISGLRVGLRNLALVKMEPKAGKGNLYPTENSDVLRAKEKERQTKETEAFELGFKQQTKDQNWSDKVGGQIRQAFASANIAAENILSIDCRVSMCRIELADDAHQEKGFETLSMALGQELPNIRADQTELADGGKVTVLYLSKDDFIPSDNGS